MLSGVRNSAKEAARDSTMKSKRGGEELTAREKQGRSREDEVILSWREQSSKHLSSRQPASRPDTLPFSSLKIRQSAFLSLISFVDPMILSVLSCQKLGLAARMLLQSLSWLSVLLFTYRF